MPNRKSWYEPEFKAEAVQLAKSGSAAKRGHHLVSG